MFRLFYFLMTTKNKNRTVSSRKKKKKKKKTKPYTQRFTITIGCCTALIIYAFIFNRFIFNPFLHHTEHEIVDVPSNLNVRGIDISHHQGDIDWKELKKAKIGRFPISFVFIKATEGTSHIDDYFSHNFYYARENGFTRSAYHYFKPLQSPKKQAEHFLRQVHLEEGDLPPILDIEEIGLLTKHQLQKRVLTWLQLVEKAYNTRPILYTSAIFKQKYLNTQALNKYPFWVAHYYVQIPKTQTKWHFWQFTDRAKLPGIPSFVDCNTFNGTKLDLQNMMIRNSN